MSLKNTHQIWIIFTIHGAGHLDYINKYNATEPVISLLIVCFFGNIKGFTLLIELREGMEGCFCQSAYFFRFKWRIKILSIGLNSSVRLVCAILVGCWILVRQVHFLYRKNILQIEFYLDLWSTFLTFQISENVII